ncbi:MAG: hypothetical protein QF681_16620, partial [Vicinamibacterales bacterium]|nr:hypothetical protein [Vicinamibacterales bacterium]
RRPSFADDERMRDLVASGDVPDLSQPAGDGDFADARLNVTLDCVAFAYIEERWESGRWRCLSGGAWSVRNGSFRR